MRKRSAQDYSAEEFDAVVHMIQSDASLRADIEAITRQKLDDKTPRELFDTFRAIKQAAEVQKAVVEYGHARQAVRRTRAMLAEGALEDRDPTDPAIRRISELEARNDELKAVNERLKNTNKALMEGKVAPISGRMITGEVAS
ncbi:hypothetical protein [Nonomuraea angiospora]|uniref:hypothetical protein n=1 Tax=Nonomuraea angiospora TaxID=46172 RepID=UPI0029A903DA|nr:hypothetical protein [Nonomuraea angiospora]MDX3111384.1 hypothetical protein [Nonomuraea angiospora]